MYYANAEQLSQEITFLVNAAQSPLRWLCIEASAVDDIDYTAAETLRSIFVILKEKGVRLVVVNASGGITAEKYGLPELFGADAIYHALDDVVKAYHREREPAREQLNVTGMEPGTSSEASVVPHAN
jgi:MFS superfamily sulfate permease-like transporter